MKSRVITISREFGSGGRTIGKKWQKNWAFRAMTRKSSWKCRRKGGRICSRQFPVRGLFQPDNGTYQ